MKFLQLFLLFSLSVFLKVSAQDPEHPVNWTFSIEQKDAGSYVLIAEAHLAPGFHLWALNAGGDGSLIPTSFSFDEENEIRWMGNWEETPKPDEQILEYVDGAVRWHENKVAFQRIFQSENPMPINGFVRFQICNESSCFPPEEKDFQLQVK